MELEILYLYFLKYSHVNQIFEKNNNSIFIILLFSFLRSEFEDALPCERTVREWCTRNNTFKH